MGSKPSKEADQKAAKELDAKIKELPFFGGHIENAQQEAHIRATKAPYRITVKTGNQSRSGTDGTVSITFFGGYEMTKRVVLSNRLRNNFEQYQSDAFVMDLADVGDLQWCKIELEEWGLDPSWYVDYIKVDVDGKKYYFPVYQWIEKELFVPEGKASTPKMDTTPNGKILRQLCLNNQMDKYRWHTFRSKTELTYGLNNYMEAKTYEDLPVNARWGPTKNAAFYQVTSEGRKNAAIAAIFKNMETMDVLNDPKFMDKMLRLQVFKKKAHLDAPWYKWRSDREFARQQMNGCRPRGVFKVRDGIPSNYSITDADLVGVMPEGKTIDSEIKAGRLFIVDNSVMEGVPTSADVMVKPPAPYYSCSPMLLLRCNEEGSLDPLAIQLHSNRTENNPVFTPNDGEYDWLAAKVCMNHTSIIVQQLDEHLVCCHLVTEPFAVALRRRLSADHPMYKFLFPHLCEVHSINTYGRPLLIDPSGLLNYIMSVGGSGAEGILKQAFKNWNVNQLDMPYQLKLRGTDDPNMIKQYGLRDDGLKYWAAIRKYVRGILDLYYDSDESIKADVELQAFFKEVKDIGLQFVENSGMPDSIEGLNQVESLLTGLIFQCTIQHSAEGNASWDVYANAALHPFSLRTEPPKRKGEFTKEKLRAMLPSDLNMSLQLGLVYTTTGAYGDEEVFIGEFPQQLFSEEAPLAVLQQLTDDVNAIGKEIDARNATWEVPYAYLRPTIAPAKIDY